MVLAEFLGDCVFESFQCDFELSEVGFSCGDSLHPQTGRGENFDEEVIMAAGVADELEAETDDDGDGEDFQTEAEPDVIPSKERIYNNGNNKHNEHEACAASGVESGAGSGVFGGERKTFLEAGYRFMLRAGVENTKSYVNWIRLTADCR